MADIARELDIRYQFAYQVVRRAAGGTPLKENTAPTVKVPKPELSKDVLLAAGFEQSGTWKIDSEGAIHIIGEVPTEAGVYAFVVDGVAVYVGLASMNLAKRLYFYRKPGKSQVTNIRLNHKIADLLGQLKSIDLMTCTVKPSEWNGLPINMAAGLELGLIKKFHLDWNVRSSD